MSYRWPLLLRSPRACWQRAIGRLWLALGRFERARLRFQRALQLAGDDYLAHVYLGRIAYALGDYHEWRREIDLARCAAPERYARLREAFERSVPRAAGALVERTRQRTERRESRQPPASRSRIRPLEEVEAPWQATEAGPDDFASAEERARFLPLPPLQPIDLAAVDLEDLIRQLGADAERR